MALLWEPYFIFDFFLLTLQDISSSKGRRKLTMLTAYDYPTSKILSTSGIDILLVGDSLGMVVLGYPDTKSVTLEDMVHHGSAVVRGNKGSFVVVDMPIHTTDTCEEALKNCRYLLDRTGADAVKIEGQSKIVQYLVKSGVVVMGHVGLKPQTAKKYGIRGKNPEEAEAIFFEARALQKAGVCAIVLECIPSFLARKITETLAIPTIGIGAGGSCDGQVLVTSDMLGFFDDFSPKFVRRYFDMVSLIQKVCVEFQKDVENGTFPSDAESY